MLSREFMGSKLPYNLNHAEANQSRERLRPLKCDKYIIAHRDICSREEFLPLIDDNLALIQQRAGEILEMITRPMAMCEITHARVRPLSALHQKAHPGPAVRAEHPPVSGVSAGRGAAGRDVQPGASAWFYRP